MMQFFYSREEKKKHEGTKSVALTYKMGFAFSFVGVCTLCFKHVMIMKHFSSF
jgi:hypothetical protein